MQSLNDILKLAENEAAPLGLLVVDARICQQGRQRVLEVSICRKGGRISLDDCEELSRKLDKALDEHSPPLIDGAYHLEVQSPGLDRQLKTEREFSIFAGETVEVKSKDPQPVLGDHFVGQLHSLVDGVLTISKPEPLRQESTKRRKKASAVVEEKMPEQISVKLDRISQVRLRPEDVSERLKQADEKQEQGA